MDWQERFADLPARCESIDEIDAAIDSWTAGQNHIDLMNALQHCGVSAGAVMNGPQLLADPHLSARDAFLEQDRPGLGVKRYPNQPFRLRNAPASPVARAPLLGEHTEEVLTALVGTAPLAARR